MSYLENPPNNAKNYFAKEEFERHGFPADPSGLEIFLMRNLVFSILNPIRIAVGRPITIDDCYRTSEKYDAMLLDKLYNPSKTSDHFWGQTIPLVDPSLKAKFGPYYTFSVGAVDFRIPSAQDMTPLFEKIVSMDRVGLVNTGQCILEAAYDSDKKMTKQWIHISNPRTLVYTQTFIKKFGIVKAKYLVSNDNGKTYQAVA
jgi:hypothetical protein